MIILSVVNGNEPRRVFGKVPPLQGSRLLSEQMRVFRGMTHVARRMAKISALKLDWMLLGYETWTTRKKRWAWQSKPFIYTIPPSGFSCSSSFNSVHQRVRLKRRHLFVFLLFRAFGSIQKSLIFYWRKEVRCLTGEEVREGEWMKKRTRTPSSDWSTCLMSFSTTQFVS